jgi:hypothetical protein
MIDFFVCQGNSEQSCLRSVYEGISYFIRNAAKLLFAKVKDTNAQEVRCTYGKRENSCRKATSC